MGFVEVFRISHRFWAFLWRYAHAIEPFGHLRVGILLRGLLQILEGLVYLLERGDLLDPRIVLLGGPCALVPHGHAHH